MIGFIYSRVEFVERDLIIMKTISRYLEIAALLYGTMLTRRWRLKLFFCDARNTRLIVRSLPKSKSSRCTNLVSCNGFNSIVQPRFCWCTDHRRIYLRLTRRIRSLRSITMYVRSINWFTVKSPYKFNLFVYSLQIIIRVSLTSHEVNAEIVSIYDYHGILHVFYYITLYHRYRYWK